MTQSHGKRFFCREWAFAKINHYLESRCSSKTCGTLITGGPGSGKTALCNELVWPTNTQGKQNSLSKKLLAYHFCQANDIKSLSVAFFINNLISQITASPLISGYKEKIKELQISECDPDEAFKKGVLFPLLEIDPPRHPCFILVDSLDQSILGGEKNGIAELLANYHHLFPRWLLLICSSRKQSKNITRMFTGFRKISLDDLRKCHVVRDVQQYILSRLDKEEALRQHLSRETAEMLNQLHIKSNGCFMYLEKVLDGVSENFIMIREIREIPGTLNGLYLWLSQRLFMRKQFSKVQPILNVILASRKPLTEEVLYQCVWTRNTNLSYEEYQKRLSLLSKVVIKGRGGTKILFHHSFAEWLLDVKHCTQKYLCNAKDGHAMIAMRYTIASSQLTPEEISDFALHLSKISLSASLQPHHITLWLMYCNLPLEDFLEKNTFKVPIDPLESIGADIDQVDSNQRTLLHRASHEGMDSLVSRLIEKGSNLEKTDKNGQSPINLAARQGHSCIVEMLLKAGANADHADNDGWTPLRSSAWAGHTEVCELLLENEADVDHSDNNGRTPLVAAASMGHPAVVNLLLFWGAAVDTIDAEGRTVLSIAAAQGNPKSVRQLLDRGLDEMHRDNGGWTPLHYAAFEGHIEACDLLLEAGAKITEIDNDGRVPLILAAQEGHTKLIETLLHHTPSIVDSRAHDGKTAFRIATLEGHKDTVKLLINHGANINYKDADGRSTLYLLALENRTDMGEFLLAGGADVEARDLEGRTALHVSAWQGHTDMVELLLNHGADVNAVDNDYRTALQSAAWQGHVSVVRLILERNAIVDHVCNQGATALCIAAQEGHLEVVKVLLEYGADPNHVDQFGRNPIRVATKGGHSSVIHLLEEYIQESASECSSHSTAETKPCSAILCPPLESPEDKRRSFISNQSSSSNLTNSTNNSKIEITFTQQLQQCTRNRNRISRLLSPLSEPQNDQCCVIPREPRTRRNGIVTNPNYKGNNKSSPINNHSQYEESLPLKKETHL
ncbi:ankyrin repeat domain-containing protein 50 isoform X2 [Parasteatoda tepidariorum]|uniref:ankyrin repeat domain-containing protein 50 isoform X2 n=1 Tax=Parasteatoda tepidariorum TaxID=114398 RepID=UPI001C729C26|nr:ankyrin repeat domain-containing protein 50 isoform X2 [Parasteatoda tepidariorum]